MNNISEEKLNCQCEVCGKKFYRPPYYIKQTKHLTCSYKCSNELRKVTMAGENNPQYGRKGELSPTFKNFTRISHGYRVNYKPEHPFTKENYIREHRLIAEQYLLDDINSINIDETLYLNPKFVVHHIDCDKLNNDIDNLCVMTKEDHSAMHITFKTIFRNDKGQIMDIKNNYETKEELREAFFEYINNHNIYYHIINKINIPDSYFKVS